MIFDLASSNNVAATLRATVSHCGEDKSLSH